MNNTSSSRPAGVSLIIAIVFVAAFLLVLGGITQVQVRANNGIRDRRNEVRAVDLLEAAKEIASFWGSRNREGQNLTDSSDAQNDAGDILQLVASEHGIGNCDTYGDPGGCAGVWAYGRAADAATDVQIDFNGSEYFSVPALIRDRDGNPLATGDAADTCADLQDADDPCNWNRIYVGESVEVPLYYKTDSGGSAIKPTFNNDDDFMLRIRTPCDGYATGETTCPAVERLSLYPLVSSNAADPYRHVEDLSNNGLVEKDPVIVQWTINDEETETSLKAADDSSNNLRPLPDILIRLTENSELSAGRINDANPNSLPAQYLGNTLPSFVILQTNHEGKDIDNLEQSIETFLNNVSEPVFQLSFIERPKRDDGQASTAISSTDFNNSSLDVPYLEYQILTREEVSDSKKILYGWSQTGNVSKVFKEIFKLPSSLGGFVLENF